MSGNGKRPLVPRLRFPEFQGVGEWNLGQFEHLATPISPPKKIPTTEYLSKGRFPVIDQGQGEIAGWTNDRDALVADDQPLLVFGDHTCTLKLVRGAFAQGADGIKILKSTDLVIPDYLYQYLCFHPVAAEEYKRHFSILKERVIAYPERLRGEQERIVKCLSSSDERIAAERDKLDTLKALKKGLMQHLFPADGETLPRLRFSNFQGAGQWRRTRLSDLLVRSVRAVDVDVERMYQEIGIRSHGRGIFHKSPVIGKALGEKRVFWVDEDALVVNIVFAWEQAVAVTSTAEAGMIASHRFPMYKPKNGRADVNFVRYFFLTKKGKELLGIASPGGAGRNKTLGQSEFEKLELLSPESVAEQAAIANALLSLDDLITAQVRRVELLRRHKKGLMQQLFPELEEVLA